MHLAPIDVVFASSWLDAVIDKYPTLFFLIAWGVAMLSYHQDAKLRLVVWAVVSQIFAFVCVVNVVVLGFTHKSWPNFVIAPALIWLHVQFTKRWWARPGKWW